MVTETLKNGSFIPIDTSKGSDFNSDFKYISFIKFNLTHQTVQSFFFVFFPRGDRIDPVVLENHDRAHSNGN